MLNHLKSVLWTIVAVGMVLSSETKLVLAQTRSATVTKWVVYHTDCKTGRRLGPGAYHQTKVAAERVAKSLRTVEGFDGPLYCDIEVVPVKVEIDYYAPKEKRYAEDAGGSSIRPRIESEEPIGYLSPDGTYTPIERPKDINAHRGQIESEEPIGILPDDDYIPYRKPIDVPKAKMPRIDSEKILGIAKELNRSSAKAPEPKSRPSAQSKPAALRRSMNSVVGAWADRRWRWIFSVNGRVTMDGNQAHWQQTGSIVMVQLAQGMKMELRLDGNTLRYVADWHGNTRYANGKHMPVLRREY